MYDKYKIYNKSKLILRVGNLTDIFQYSMAKKSILYIVETTETPNRQFGLHVTSSNNPLTPNTLVVLPVFFWFSFPLVLRIFISTFHTIHTRVITPFVGEYFTNDE